MKDKHLKARIAQCLAIAECSPCPRRKFGALLIDPERNVVLMDGYNGGPRGGGSICGGVFCLRDGAPTDRALYGSRSQLVARGSGIAGMIGTAMVNTGDIEVVLHTDVGKQVVGSFNEFEALFAERNTSTDRDAIIEDRTQKTIDAFIEEHPPIKSGTHYELGCHHAEMNVITNAAARGVACDGAWLIVTGEPCVLCAKLIHHAGIRQVICVKGGFVGGDAGPQYLRKHGVKVVEVDGPQDPRFEVSS